VFWIRKGEHDPFLAAGAVNGASKKLSALSFSLSRFGENEMCAVFDRSGAERYAGARGMRSSARRGRSFALCGAAIIAGFILSGRPAGAVTEDFTKMSLEELMNVEVTTATKAPQALFSTAAAAFVITQEDIRRSGATNVPELLRMVPGIEVARLNAHTYAITARGFNGVYANKLLVLIDGRSVYTPLFSGVQWDLQDLMLEDVDRIEVIRGPGGTLWGANAFNGVINIITKNSAETLDGLATAHAGNLEQGGAVRHGGTIGSDTAFRVFGKVDHHDAETAVGGGSAYDQFVFGRAGFRVDSTPAPDVKTMFEGGAVTGTEGDIWHRLTPFFPFPAFIQQAETPVSAAHLLGRMVKTIAPGEEWQLQSYLDWTDRFQAILGEQRLTWDVEAQHSSTPFPNHLFIWGGGYRLTTDTTQGTFDLSLVPASNTEHLANLFAQDEISLIPKVLTLTLGSKFEYNNWSGFDIQPNIRAMWHPEPNQALWAAISRAVRTPSRAERNLDFNFTLLTPPITPFPTLVSVFGNPQMVSEKVIAYELGYRWQPVPQVSLDLASFYNTYTSLGTFDEEPPILLGGLPDLPVVVHNAAHGHAYGIEFAGGWQPTPWLTFRTAYTFQRTKLFRDSDSTDTTSIAYQNSIPKHQLSARASFDLTRDVALDVTGRYVGRLALSAADSPLLSLPDVSSYWALDLRLGWHVTDRVLLELIGQNLNRSAHIEFFSFGPAQAATAEIGRSVFARVTVKF
jgi:iron complex outermembrane receptor protein